MTKSRWVGKLWSPLLGAALLTSLSVSGAGAASASPSGGTTSVRHVSAFRHIHAMPVGNSKAVITPDTQGKVFGAAAARVLLVALDAPPDIRVQLSWPVLVTGLALTVLSAVVFGLPSALQIVRPDHRYRPMAQKLRDAADMIEVMVSE